MYVPEMAAIMGGAVDARIHVDYNSLTAYSEAALDQSAWDTVVEANLDKDNLEDGKYTLNAEFWHAVSNQESMGNPALNKPSLLTVKSGVYTLEVSTRPMVIGTITSCLQSIQIKQRDGTYKYAKIKARNNEGNQPSVFRIVLPSKEDYTDIKIDPKVEIMGNVPLAARLKIDWDTLVRVSNETKITENNEAPESESSITADSTYMKADVNTGQRANSNETEAKQSTTALQSIESIGK